MIFTNKIYTKIENRFLSFLRYSSTKYLKGFLQTTRVAVVNNKSSDARPLVVKKIKPDYISVITGKMNCIIWFAGEVDKMLVSHRGLK